MNTHDTLKAMLAALLLAVGMSEAPARVPQTGQAGCWDQHGNITPCTQTGMDGDLQKGKIKELKKRFRINKKTGGIVDRVTGLEWYGQPRCLQTPATWSQALQIVRNLNVGYARNVDKWKDCNFRKKDWRLPNVKEAQTLTDFSKGSETWRYFNRLGGRLNSPAFTLWTSTTCTNQGLTYEAFMVNLHKGGLTFCEYKGNAKDKSVWPVRRGR